MDLKLRAMEKCQTLLRSLESVIECEWTKISNDNLEPAVKSFRSRLEKCLAAAGGILEK